MARGVSAGSPHASGSEPKTKLSSITTGGTNSARSTKMTANESQKTTTAPSVKMPSMLMVTDSKGRTPREQRVDAWNRANPAVSGDHQFMTPLEREKAMIATTYGSGSKSGAASTLPGMKKIAQ